MAGAIGGSAVEQLLADLAHALPDCAASRAPWSGSEPMDRAVSIGHGSWWLSLLTNPLASSTMSCGEPSKELGFSLKQVLPDRDRQAQRHDGSCTAGR